MQYQNPKTSTTHVKKACSMKLCKKLSFGVNHVAYIKTSIIDILTYSLQMKEMHILRCSVLENVSKSFGTGRWGKQHQNHKNFTV